MVAAAGYLWTSFILGQLRKSNLTFHDMHSRQAESGQFPLVCVDEAGFTLDPPLLPILAAARRLILVLS